MPETPSLVFGKYALEYRLAVGGMGEVYFASSKTGPESLVVKTLQAELAEQQELVTQFLDEARLAVGLKHPNIVSTYEVGPWNGTYALAMEYVHGRDLSSLLTRATRMGTQVPAVVAVQIIRDAARALHHAHTLAEPGGRSLQIVHRDISPQNIMATFEGSSKVVDFGIASTTGRETRTATGVIKGKLAYMSPEQANGRKVTAASDQFSLGLVLYELLSGKQVYSAPNDVALIKMVMSRELPASMSRSTPKGLEAIVMKMLAENPSDRYPNCEAVAVALEQELPKGASAQVQSFMKQLGSDDLEQRKQATPHLGNIAISLATPARPKHEESTRQLDVVKPAVPKKLSNLERYLAELPNGLASYSEAQCKASLIAGFTEGLPLQEHLHLLPPELSQILKKPPTPSTWLSEVHATAIYMATIDLCFPDHDSYVEFAYRANKKVLSGPLYAVLFRFIGPKRVGGGVVSAWPQFHRGGLELKQVSASPTNVTLALVGPEKLIPLVLARCYGTALTAALETGGRKNVISGVNPVSPTTFEVTADP